MGGSSPLQRFTETVSWISRSSATAEDGSVDLSFGANGITYVDFDGGHDGPVRVLVQNDVFAPAIYVAGSVHHGGDSDLGVAKLDFRGRLVDSFGDGGRTVIGWGYEHELLYDAALTPDGKVVVIGRTLRSFFLGGGHYEVGVARIDHRGELDSSFNGDGKFRTDTNKGATPGALSVSSNGDVLFSGYDADDERTFFYLYNKNGERIFGQAQVGANVPRQIVQLPDGNHLLLSGSRIYRLIDSRRLDPRFSDERFGYALAPAGAREILVANDRFYVVGSEPGACGSAEIRRYHFDGREDEVWGDAGRLNVDFAPSAEFCSKGMTLNLRDDQLLVGGRLLANRRSLQAFALLDFDGEMIRSCEQSEIDPDIPDDSPRFRRGDVNESRRVDISDAVGGLEFLFASGQAPTCMKAMDTNDDGRVDISDPAYLLAYLFVGGAPPVGLSEECDQDATADNLECEISSSCD